ncbi:SLAP domain-containing protein [Exiguobacterium sp. Helios]|uniref:SLAP domain-containing protein n=1 Tax=Exiguobacterium sp. Helios TaxID=2735868 RepID=UPI00103BC54E|nr:SLAP domain-containing protein [Exiguobacterium sp. Helios]QNR22038.1 SLAP domain-containing protein [Exiguobacterium sp. Helios]
MQPSIDSDIQPALYFTEDMPIVKEDEYVFRYALNQLPKLGPNQLAIHLFQVLQTEPLHVIALFQNTLPRSFQLNDLVVLVLSGDQLVARKIFTIEEVPVLLPTATLPLWLEFSDEEQFVDLSTLDAPLELVFSNEQLTDLVIDESFSAPEQRLIRQIAFSHPAPPTDGWSLLPVSIFKQEQKVEAIVLVRNPSGQSLELDSLSFELLLGDQAVAATRHTSLTVSSQSEHAIRLSFDYVAHPAASLDLRYLPE